jgi:beta-lactamase class A
VAGDVLVDPLHGRGALRDGRDDDRAGPAGASAIPHAGAGLRGAAAAAPGAFRRPPLKPFAALAAGLALAASLSSLPAEKPAPISKLDPAPALEELLAKIAAETVADFEGAGLTADGLSIAVIDLTNPTPVSSFPAASYRGDVPYYPCSVVKLCYLSYYGVQREAGRLADSPELSRAVTDMITVSSNDATGFVVDSLTGTTSGPEIADAREWERWKAKRNVVNDWFHARGYTTLNANQKTFCEDAYGREQAFRENGKNRNRMTAAEAARILKELVRNEVAGPLTTDAMLRLLARDIAREQPFEEMEPEDARLAGQGLPRGSRLWAKSGDAFDFHHLVGRVALPNGADFVIAVFTKGVKTVPGVIPRVYERVAEHFMGRRP